MHRYLTMIVTAILLASCAYRYVPVKESNNERSVMIKQRTEVVTIFPEFRIPAISESRHSLRDSVSVLENQYAKSIVRIYHNGSINHCLETRPQIIHDSIMVPVQVIDTLISESRVQTDTVTMEVEKRFNGWQRFIQYAGYALLVLIVAFIALCLLNGRLNSILTIFKNLIKL